MGRGTEWTEFRGRMGLGLVDATSRKRRSERRRASERRACAACAACAGGVEQRAES